MLHFIFISCCCFFSLFWVVMNSTFSSFQSKVRNRFATYSYSQGGAVTVSTGSVPAPGLTSSFVLNANSIVKFTLNIGISSNSYGWAKLTIQDVSGGGPSVLTNMGCEESFSYNNPANEGTRSCNTILTLSPSLYE